VPTQDSFVYHHLGYDLGEHVTFEDIPATPLPLLVVEAPVATVPSPTPGPHSPTSGVLSLLRKQPVADLFPYLFNTPACTLAVDCYPHQYTVVYDHGEKYWVPQEEYIERDFLCLLPRIPNLKTYPVSFVTPFRVDIYHNVHIHTLSHLPSIHICAKVGRHPHSASFPFGYLKSSFIDSIKFIFSQFPPTWLKYFEGALIPLTVYDFLDGQVTLLCGHLHFTADRIFVVNCNTRTEDLLCIQPRLATFVCTPCVPVNPFSCVMPPPLEIPL